MIEIRRLQTQVEEIFHEFGPPPAEPLLRGAIAVVLTNPYAGRYEADILPMMKALEPLAIDLTERVLVKDVPAGYECTHLGEPPLPDLTGPTGWQIFLKGELIAAQP